MQIYRFHAKIRMATLDDKILGEKLHNYCSSSEDEGENDSEASVKSTIVNSDNITAPDRTHWSGSAENTGPKGVINDWQRFKQLENEKREEKEREKLDLLKKLSITSRTKAEDEKLQEEEELDPELLDLMRDETLLQFQKQRMAEMLANSGKQSTFKQIFNLANGDDFLNAVDKEAKHTTVIIHIYEQQIKACKTMNTVLETLAVEYPNIKFCRMLSSCAGMSRNFKKGGVPALLVYKGGQMIGNFVRLSDEFGDDFYPSDVESFLIEHAMIEDRSCIPKIAADTNLNDDDD